jgi:hypothetical protein
VGPSQRHSSYEGIGQRRDDIVTSVRRVLEIAARRTPAPGQLDAAKQGMRSTKETVRADLARFERDGSNTLVARHEGLVDVAPGALRGAG